MRRSPLSHGSLPPCPHARPPQDLERAWDAVRHAKRPRVHTFIATSEIHMKVCACVCACVRMCRERGVGEGSVGEGGLGEAEEWGGRAARAGWR